TRLPPLRGPLRGAHAARDVRRGLRGLLPRGASVGSALHPLGFGVATARPRADGPSRGNRLPPLAGWAATRALIAQPSRPPSAAKLPKPLSEKHARRGT